MPAGWHLVRICFRLNCTNEESREACPNEANGLECEWIRIIKYILKMLSYLQKQKFKTVLLSTLTYGIQVHFLARLITSLSLLISRTGVSQEQNYSGKVACQTRCKHEGKIYLTVEEQNIFTRLFRSDLTGSCGEGWTQDCGPTVATFPQACFQVDIFIQARVSPCI